MTEFNLGNLRAWEQVRMCEPYAFAVPEGGFRNVKFDILADSDVSVYAETDEGCYLIGTGRGKFSCRFSADRPFEVKVMGEDDARAMIRRGSEVGVMPDRGAPSFTTPQPRGSEMSSDLKRMMRIMKINEERRTAAYNAEVARLRGLVEAGLAPVGADQPKPGRAGRKAAAAAAAAPAEEGEEEATE